MKIAFAEKFLFSIPRGIERTTISLANALSMQGHDVTLVTPRVTQKRNAVEPLPSVHVHFVPIFRYYQHYQLIPFYLVDFALNRYDMIFISFGGYGEGIAVRLANLLWQQEYCIQLHYPLDGHEHRYREFKQHRIAGHAKRILAASRYLANQAEEYLGRCCTPTPNGVDINHFCPPLSKGLAKTQAGFASTDKIILSVAALDKRKGIHKIIPALAQVARQYPEVKLVVLGEGPFRKELENLIQTYGLQNHILLTGTVRNVLAYYQAADVFILLAEQEANSISVYEAWACGLPVVTRQGDAYSEVVTDEVGRMVDDNNTASITEALLEFLSDDSKRRLIASRARRYVEENYTWEIAARKLIQKVVETE